jgi:N-acetylglucosamine-6-phosphate deacetylase
MLVIAGGDLVLPDRIVADGALVIEGARITAIARGPYAAPAGATVVDARDCYVVPGFVDVHVHGVEGHDTLDPGDSLARIARALPRYGVTAFCPTTVACAPRDLHGVLQQIEAARGLAPGGGARVLPAHLESNFINPAWCGAQPVGCLRLPTGSRSGPAGTFSGADILEVLAGNRANVGIVTLAPELEGGLALVRTLVEAGHRVSLGHSGASFEAASAAFDAGARHATHLFNRTPPLSHRSPGLVGAALARGDVSVELICDGYHVHPAVARMTIAAKGVSRVMAITDGTAGSGLPPGAAAQLGGRPIQVREEAAFLDDGTLAGSTLTMDRAIRIIVHRFGCSVLEAAHMCATTPARALGLQGCGHLAEGAAADVVVLDRQCRVRRTFVAGQQVHGVA